MLRTVQCHQHAPFWTMHPRQCPEPATIAENTQSKYPGGTLSGIRRMWLPHGMRPMPNGVRAFEMPRPLKGDAGATKGTDSAWKTPKKPQGRYRVSHTGRYARTPIRQRRTLITHKPYTAFKISHTKA